MTLIGLSLSEAILTAAQKPDPEHKLFSLNRELLLGICSFVMAKTLNNLMQILGDHVKMNQKYKRFE